MEKTNNMSRIQLTFDDNGYSGAIIESDDTITLFDSLMNKGENIGLTVKINFTKEQLNQILEFINKNK